MRKKGFTIAVNGDFYKEVSPMRIQSKSELVSGVLFAVVALTNYIVYSGTPLTPFRYFVLVAFSLAAFFSIWAGFNGGPRRRSKDLARPTA